MVLLVVGCVMPLMARQMKHAIGSVKEAVVETCGEWMPIPPYWAGR
jgi:hypothetical protein